MRKEHPAFRMRTTGEIAANLVFDEKPPDGIVGYTINGEPLKDSWKKIKIYFNGTAVSKEVDLDHNTWHAAIINNELKSGITDTILTLRSYSCTILYTQ